MSEDITGKVLEIQRMSTEDGPGLRTTVFLKGCSLRCAWCHNPESISLMSEIHWIGNRCINCGLCITACPHGALSSALQGIVIDRSTCTGCGTCVEECPTTALDQLGKKWTVPDLIHEVIKDRDYFETSGGGITLSGGEPAVQPAFSRAFLKGLRDEKVHTALDTCGFYQSSVLFELLPHADLVLYDIKEIEPGLHKRFVHGENGLILDNLVRLGAFMREKDCPSQLWIRTPIIPGATERKENIAGIGAFLSANLNDLVSRWELCAFNNMCIDKYRRLDREWPFAQTPLIMSERMDELADVARSSGVDPAVVMWSGTVRQEDEFSKQDDINGTVSKETFPSLDGRG